MINRLLRIGHTVGPNFLLIGLIYPSSLAHDGRPAVFSRNQGGGMGPGVIALRVAVRVALRFLLDVGQQMGIGFRVPVIALPLSLNVSD